MHQLRSLFWAALLCFASLSMAAQWQWLDQNGRRVYSDRPPPPETSQKNILRQGGATRPNEAPLPSTSTEPGSTQLPQGVSGAPAAQQSDRKALEQAKLDKDVENNKRKAEQDMANQIRAENCQRAQRGVLSYSSGVRVFIINPQGEREVLDDSTREVELQRLQSIIQSDCGQLQ